MRTIHQRRLMDSTRRMRLALSLAFLLILCGTAAAQSVGIAISNTDVHGESNNAGLATATLPSFNVPAGNNRELIVGISTSFGLLNPLTDILPVVPPSDRVVDVSYNGQSLTRIGTQVSPDGLNSVEMFRLELGSGIAITDDIDVTLAGVSYVVIGAISFTGVNQTDPLRNQTVTSDFVSNSGTSGITPSVTVTSAPGDVVLDTVGTEPDGGLWALFALTDQTEQWNGSSEFSNAFSVGAGSTAPGAPSVLMRWQNVASDWAIGGISLQPAQTVSAIVISEFRTRGTGGAGDEFVEIYNRSTSSIDIGGYILRRSSSCGTTVNALGLAVPTGTILGPGCHYLFTSSSGYSGGVAADQTFSSGISDDGGLALFNSSAVIVDQVGMCSTTLYKEGNFLPPLSTVGSNQSYERKPGGTAGSSIDTNDNLTDFSVRPLNDPQRSTSTCIAATLADVTNFTVSKTNQGVLLDWDTSYEVNNLGFNVYREEKGRQVRVNPSLIAGSALLAGSGTRLTAGFSYSWLDAQGKSDSVYWLEDVDLDGTRTLHGPVAASANNSNPAQKRQQAALLNQLSSAANSTNAQVVVKSAPAAALSLSPASAASTKAAAAGQVSSNTLASRAAVKIGVRQNGWYRVTQPQLVAAGLNSSVDPRMLQLYADGVEQSIKVVSRTGRMDAGAYLEFYGTGLDTPSTDTRTYWLITGTTPGKRIFTFKDAGTPPVLTKPSTVTEQPRSTIVPGRRPGANMKNNHAAAAEAIPQSFSYTTTRRERTLYFSALQNGDAENFFGAILSTTPVEQTINVHHLDRVSSEQPVLEVVLQGVTMQAHEVKVLLNGTVIGTASYTGQANSSTRIMVRQSLLREGANTVKLITQAGEADVSLVDSLKLTYAHLYRADTDRLYMSAKGSRTIRADGFTSAGVRVLDVTNPAEVREIIPQVKATGTAGYAITFQTGESQSKTPRTLLAFTDNQFDHPAEIKANVPSRWSQKGLSADLVIITHGQLRQSIEPLARLRRNQGKLVTVIDVEDLYDEFSYGAHSPHAIKEFLSWTRSNWTRAPRFVLLAGDGSYDPRNYQARGQFDLVPTKMLDTKYMETAADDWFADFNNDGVAEMATGRLPVRNSQEAAAIVSKIVNYSPASNSGRGVLLVSDRADAFNFEAASNDLKAIVPATINVQSIARGAESADATRTQIIDGLNQGQLIANYVGHGSFEKWTGDGVLRATDATALAGSGKSSLFVTMTCMNGYYHSTTGDSLAEAMLKVENGGAVAVWASSGITFPTAQAEINRKLYQQLFASPALTLGEAVQRAKAATTDLDVRRTWILFGDPTMRIR